MGFYWMENLGEYTSGDSFDTKFELAKTKKNEYCKNKYLIKDSDLTFDTLADFKVDRKKEESDNDFNARQRRAKEIAIMSPKANYQRTVVSFMQMLNGNEVF